MRVWLVNPYGPLPGEAWREYRFAMIARALAAQGHDVIWWTAAFSHHFKRFRSREWQDLAVAPGFTIRLAPTPGYRRHIGAGRLWFEAVFAARTWARGRASEPPECVIAADPPQCVGWVGAALARHHRARLIIDVMDLWPELFTLAFPRRLRLLAPVVLAPLYALRRRNLRRADALTALCDTYLDAAKRAAGNRTDTPAATVFNGIDVAAFGATGRHGAAVLGLPPKRPGEVRAIYAGTLGENYDIPTLLEAMRRLQGANSCLHLLLAGEGPLLGRVLEATRNGLHNVTYLGRLEPEGLAACYRHADIGVCAYSADSNVAMPDKAYDYLAAGLPLVNSLPGELAGRIRKHRLGVSYRAGDAASLAEALSGLAADAAARGAMAAHCRALAPEFDCGRQYAQFARLIEALAGNGQPLTEPVHKPAALARHEQPS